MPWDSVHGGKQWLEMKFKYLPEVDQIVENELMLEFTQWGNYCYDLHFTNEEAKTQKIDLPSPHYY